MTKSELIVFGVWGGGALLGYLALYLWRCYDAAFNKHHKKINWNRDGGGYVTGPIVWPFIAAGFLIWGMFAFFKHGPHKIIQSKIVRPIRMRRFPDERLPKIDAREVER